MTGHHIAKVESASQYVAITLENGMVVMVSSNPNYLHLHFSGIDFPKANEGGIMVSQTDLIKHPFVQK